MNIQEEIIEYFKTHDYVLLPGIGGLTAEYTQPFLDKNSNIVPSKKTIRFLPYLNQDIDIKLLESLRLKHNLSSERVQEIYFEFLDRFNQSIKRDGKYDWSGLGSFFRQGDKKDLYFISSNIPSGQDSVLVPVIERAERIISKQNHQESVYDLKKDVIDNIEETEEIEEVETIGSMSFMSISLIALPLILLFSAFIYSVFFKPMTRNTVIDKSIEDVHDFPEETDLSATEMEDEWEEVGESERDIQSNALISESEKSNEAEVDLSVEHTVRIGIFRTRDEADEVAVYLAENGYPSRVRPYGRLFKVYLVAKDEQQAYQYVERVQDIINEDPVYENKEL